MAVEPEYFDTVPISEDQFTPEFFTWLSQLVDTFNSNLDLFYKDGVKFPEKTSAEVVALAPSVDNGTMWYVTDSVPPNFVAKINGALRQLDHSAFP